MMNMPEYDSTLAGLVENAVKQVKEIESTKPQLTVRIDQLKQAVISDTASLANITGAYVDDAMYTTDLKTQCEFEASEYEKGHNSITGEIAVTVKALEIISGDAVFTAAVHVTLAQKQIAGLSSEDAGLLQVEVDAVSVSTFLTTTTSYTWGSSGLRVTTISPSEPTSGFGPTDNREAVLMQFKSKLKNAECAKAKETLASAEALNTETDSTFDTENFDLAESINDLTRAIVNLEKDVAGSNFLQNDIDSSLRMEGCKVAMNFNRIYDEDHSTLLSSLSDGDHQGYASQSGEIIGILKQLKETVKMEKLVETQEKAEALPRPTRLPPWRDKLETCQSGAKSEKYLEHDASIQEGGEDTDENVKKQHSEMCKKVEVASVEEGQENVENENEKSVVNEWMKRGRRGPQ